MRLVGYSKVLERTKISIIVVMASNTTTIWYWGFVVIDAAIGGLNLSRTWDKFSLNPF